MFKYFILKFILYQRLEFEIFSLLLSVSVHVFSLSARTNYSRTFNEYDCIPTECDGKYVHSKRTWSTVSYFSHKVSLFIKKKKIGWGCQYKCYFWCLYVVSNSAWLLLQVNDFWLSHRICFLSTEAFHHRRPISFLNRDRSISFLLNKKTKHIKHKTWPVALS